MTLIKPCPFCGEALRLRGSVNDYGTCKTPNCWMFERMLCVPLDALDQIERWNTRAGADISVSAEWCSYMDEAVSRAPEPLRRLGEFLADQLDEDKWKTAERLLNAALLSRAAHDVLAERARQVDDEGWTNEHDDKHDRDHALARAAACYALAGFGANGPFWITHLQVPQQVWPYRWEWKPGDPRRNLLKAGALILAEIERMDRASGGAA